MREEGFFKQCTLCHHMRDNLSLDLINHCRYLQRVFPFHHISYKDELPQAWKLILLHGSVDILAGLTVALDLHNLHYRYTSDNELTFFTSYHFEIWIE